MNRARSRAAARRALLQLAGPFVSGLGRAGRRLAGASGEGPGGRPRILLIRPDHLGDVLLASPAAHILRAALPGARVDWLTGPWAADVARRCAGEDVVLTLPFPGFTRTAKGSLVEPYLVLLREAARLRVHRYDAALILRADHWWGALLAAAAGIPRRFGYAASECRPFLTDTLPMPTCHERHAVVTNQALARLAAERLGGRPVGGDFEEPRFPLRDDERAWARAWIAQAFAQPAGQLVVLHPGSGAALKNWPVERWATVLGDLRATRKVSTVLTGGPGERQLLEEIAARLDPPPVLAGATTLGQLAALYSLADLVLGGDSGPLHLAAAVGTPTVRVYGPTDTAEFGPWPVSTRQVALAANLSCQPCRAIVNPPCGAVSRPACLEVIDSAAVSSAVDALLAPGDNTPQPSCAATRGGC